MKPESRTRTALYALAACVVSTVGIAAMASKLWATDAPARPPPTELQATAPPLSPARSTSTTADPTLSNAHDVSAVVPESGRADDVALLRARRLILPVAGVAASQLIDNYLQLRAGGASHEALDIMAARGTPVLAVEDGRVTKLFLSKAGGTTIYQFDAGAEYVYYYAHLDRYGEGIAEGAAVLKGQVIGYVGSTGNASPDAPHLHFAVSRLGPERQWWRGTAINPFLIWRDAKR